MEKFHVEKELQSFFHRNLSHDLSLDVVHTCFKIGDMFKHKEQQPKLFRSNVVYKLTCSCDSVYIGQTRRNLRARLDDHNPAANSNHQSDVAKHLLENPTHFINFNEPEILCSEYNFKELLKKLFLSINYNRASMLIFRFLCMCLIINMCSIVCHMYVRVNMDYYYFFFSFILNLASFMMS